MTALVELEIILAHKPWQALRIEPLVRAVVLATIDHLQLKQTCYLCIKLSSDQESQALNHYYRNKNVPTNVLSFPYATSFKTPKASQELGDIIIAFETVQLEALAQKKKFSDHCAHLIVHGVLHLLGYDHVREADAEIMESLEKDILQSFGIKDPYRDHE